MSLFQHRLRWQQIKKSGRSGDKKIAYLSSFTINPLEPYLGILLEDAGLSVETLISPYNQIVQECLMEQSVTARFKPDYTVVWPRFEDVWTGMALPLVDSIELYAEELLEMAEQALDACRKWHSMLIFVLPVIPEQRPLGVGDANNPGGVFASAASARELLRQRLARQQGVLLVDAEEVVRELGRNQSYNERMNYIAKIPYSEEVFYAVAERISRVIGLSTLKPPRRVIAVDADNTLWGGVVGEDGIEGVDLADNGAGEAYREFQSHLLELRRAGVLLVLCSKNDERDVWPVFERKEMRLKKEHFASWRVGWQPKSESIRQIAEELGLGLDSFLFIDDNPAEIADVEASLPEVACMLMPADPSSAIRQLQQSGWIDRFPPTTEDLSRADFYQQQRERLTHLSKAKTSSLDEYRAGLEIRVDLFAPETVHIPRLAQLVNKTNQFNINCLRRTEAELAEICSNSDYIVRVCHCWDRFGDYGIVGAYILNKQAGCLEIDTFVLSCRALGRGVEEAMVARMFEEMREQDDHELVVHVIEQNRNEPARLFFESIGAKTGERSCLSPIVWPAYIHRVEAEAIAE